MFNAVYVGDGCLITAGSCCKRIDSWGSNKNLEKYPPTISGEIILDTAEAVHLRKLSSYISMRHFAITEDNLRRLAIN